MINYKKILREENFINGRWLQKGEGSLTVFDKFQGREMACLPLASAEQMEEAIAGAVAGFEIFRGWSAGKRSEHLQRLSELLEANKEAFADLIVREAGKPVDYAVSEINRCLVTLKTAAREALRFSGETVPIDFDAGEGKTAFTKRYPIGPVACITPFNFPLNLLLHKVAPAFAVGCPVVIKPAPQAPLSALAFAALVEKVGYPAGVFNVLACDIAVAEKMVTDPRIAMLSFTGSEKVGWYLKGICGRKKVTLELGGNAAVIVDSSADLPVAAKAVALGAFLYAGQICISTQRIFAAEDIFDKFVGLLLEETKGLKIGDPQLPGIVCGPVIDAGHLKRVDDWVKEAVQGGASVLTGGAIQDESHLLYSPTLLTGTRAEMKVSCEEVFGPVALVEKVKNFSDGVKQVNASKFGLQAGVFTKELAHLKQAHEDLDVGGIMINNVPGFRIDSMPYGGVKDSGLGREGIKYTMEEMTEPRLLVY